VSIEEVKVPVLAESVADAVLLDWQKKVGDNLQEGDTLIEIETDKVVLEVPAPKAGTLVKIVKEAGSEVLSGEVIAQIETGVVTAPQTLSPEVPEATPEVPESSTPETEVEATPSVESSTTSAKTSPAVRKMAAEQGIDPSAIDHEGDRVTKADMLQQNAQSQDLSTSSLEDEQKGEAIPLGKSQKEEATMTPALKEKVVPAQSPVPQDKMASSPETEDHLSARPQDRVSMTRLRKRVAERLLQAQHENAILTTFNEVNMKAVIDLRNQYKQPFEKQHQVKLGFMSFFSKAVVAALQKFPIINASIEGQEIVYHGYYDIGIAVSSPRGLVVPIMRDVDTMSFADIEKNIANFAQRAKDAQLTLEDLTGGTFSITNGGIFGSMLSTPILNPPQSAILGLHNIVERPVAENGQVVIRPIMYIALSYDHRLIDGRDAVQFLVAIKNAIEDPARLLFDL
jgi:2-oxoglutarate dehydrogenase E2 component (dihydrolipoamide succinyltransferase)